MFVVSNRVPVAAEWAEVFEERFRNRGGRIGRQPGLIRMEIHRPMDDRSPYVVQTVWETREDFEAWVGSEDFRAAHRNPLPKEAFSGESRIELHEVVFRARGPAREGD